MKQYRIVEVGTDELTYFKVQEKGWFFWHTWKKISDVENDCFISVTIWYDTLKEAREAIKQAISQESNKKQRIHRVVETISAPFAD